MFWVVFMCLCMSVSMFTAKLITDFVETWCYDWAYKREELITR